MAPQTALRVCVALVLTGAAAQPYPFDSRNVSASEWVCGNPPTANTSLLPLVFSDGTVVTCGTEVLQNVTSPFGAPLVTLPQSLGGLALNYTLIAVDRDARSASLPTLSPLIHWAVAGLNASVLASGYLQNISVAPPPGAVFYRNYSGPGPPAGTGCHR